jgi:hypothetical protein
MGLPPHRSSIRRQANLIYTGSRDARSQVTGWETRDPYAGLLNQKVSITLRNGLSYEGLLEQVTYTFVRLHENGGTCVLRREVIDVIRTATARVDSPQTRGAHREAVVGKVRDEPQAAV